MKLSFISIPEQGMVKIFINGKQPGKPRIISSTDSSMRAHFIEFQSIQSSSYRHICDLVPSCAQLPIQIVVGVSAEHIPILLVY